MENSTRIETASIASIATQPGLQFHPLTYFEDGDEVTVGRPDQDEYIVLPVDAAALLRHLQAGTPVPDAAEWYARTYGESIDVDSFVADLDDLGFIRRPDDAVARPVQVRWQRVARWVYSPLGAACWCLLVGGWLAAGLRTPTLLPHPRNLFFTEYMSVMVIALFLTQLPILLLHEAAHALAARRLGLRSRLSIGRRLYFLVFQTTMDGLVAVPRSKRYLPILAGILSDLAVLAALSLLADVLRNHDGSFTAVAKCLLAIAYMTGIRLLWQLWFFLQTDIYYLVVTVCGCIDLQNTAKQQLHNRFNRILGRAPKYDPASWHAHDNSAAKWYSWLVLCGYTFCLGSLVFAVLPATYRLFANVLVVLVQHSNHSATSLLDSTLLLTFTVGELSVAAAMYLRQRGTGRRPV
jgi:hypothetical protein